MFVRSHPVPPAAPTATLGARLTLWFFRHFFTLLLLAISASQLALSWWLTSAFSLAPAWVYALAVPAVFGANLRLAEYGRRRRPGSGAGSLLARVYFAGALASVFCGMFLAVSGAAWLASTSIVQVGARVAAAGTSFALGAGIDTFFRWWVNLGISTIAFSFLYGYSIGQKRLKVRRLRLPMRGAPPSWNGLRVVHISDIHVGQNLEVEELERFVARVNEVDPDLVCITGDIADSAQSDLDTFFPILAGLRARHGVFAILGNHDHYAGADRVIAALHQHTGFTVLRDAWTKVPLAGAELAVVGLDDRGRDWARGLQEEAELVTALAEIGEDIPVLLLCHRPDVFSHASRLGISWMLSGHTHGGQIAMPWIDGRARNLARFITPYDRGLFEIGDSRLYVNCGLGVTGQRIRLCTPREITVLEVEGGA